MKKMKTLPIGGILFLLILLPLLIKAQTHDEKIMPSLKKEIISSTEDSQMLIWVFLKDKGNNIENYINSPETVVSEKSLKRRGKVLSKTSLIKFEDIPVNQNYIDQLTNLGFKVKHKSKWFNAVSGYINKTDIVSISRLPFVNSIDIVKRLKSNKDVPDVEEKSNQFKSLQPEGVYSLNYGDSFTQNQQINVPAVHDLGFNGEGVTICSMDAGFNRLSHEVFSSMKIIAAFDFVNNDPGVGDSTDLGNGSHGSQTLSAIGGFKEGELIGPAFGADFILAKTENTFSETPVEEDNWIAALEWADSIGVDITTTSLGYIDYDLPFESYTWEDMDGNTMRITIAADLAVQRGIVVINSAGNEGFNADHNTLGAPADGDSVISVGAVSSTGERTSFSSVGPTVDGRIKPDIMAMGSGVRVASTSSDIGYTTGGGTSFSCPLAAGVAALILSVNPDLTPMQVRDALRNTASRNNSPDNQYGWGIINAFAAANSVSSTHWEPVPTKYFLYQNYPNPFNPSTTIQYELPQASRIKLILYDILGNKVRTLIDDQVQSGIHFTELNAEGLASGVYLLNLIAQDYQRTIKLMVAK
jgi:subtilisin family serine protease